MSVGRVSGHYAGSFSRLVAFLIDWFIIVTTYGLALGLGQYVLETFFGRSVNYAESPAWWGAGFGLWAFVYLVAGLVITGRTAGKGLMGLKVVSRTGEPLGARWAVVRVLVLPVSIGFFGLGCLGILLGKERRALHDVVARCAVVYDWGDRPAELPAPVTRWLERRTMPPHAPRADRPESPVM